MSSASSDPSTPFRILDLATQVRPDGHEASRRHTFAIAVGMQAQPNTDVVLVVNGREFEDRAIDGVDVRGVSFSSLLDDVPFRVKLWRSCVNNLTATFKISRVLSHRPDAIYERHSLGSLVGLGLSLVFGRPLVFEVNGVPDEEVVLDLGISSSVLKRLLFVVTRFQLRRAESIIVQTEELKQVLLGRYGVADVVVIPNGLSQARGTAAGPREGEPLQVCFVGTLDEIHNLEPALSAIQRSDRKFEFIIIGDGRRRALYEEALRGDDRFEFRGRLPHDEAMTVLSRSDLAIAIYDADYPLFQKYGFYLCPLKVLEYVGHGVPCVFVGLVNSMTEDLERRGAIRSVPNIDRLQAAFDELVDSHEALLQMSKRARAAAADYTWEGAANATVAALRRVAESSNS